MVRVVLFLILSFHGLYASVAEMKINEIMYYQVSGGNDEFIEFYVTASGDLEGYVVADQDGKSKQYTFPSHTVSEGDYVVFHTTSGTDSVDGNVHHFYHGKSGPYYNDGGDEVLLLKPSTTDTTVVDGETLNAIPWDYVAYDNSADGIPTSANGVTLSWNESYQSELTTERSQSLSLSYTGTDGDKSACWEATASGNASDNGCGGYVISHDSESDSSLTYSLGEVNIMLPDIKLEKSSVTIYDPINSNNNPKAIPASL